MALSPRDTEFTTQMSFAREFENIDILLNNRTETTGVDCFSLAVIKMERQMRRLFTYSVFQFPCFTYADVPAIRQALVDEGRAYFEGFMRGFDVIHPVSVSSLIGADYQKLSQVVGKAIQYRNKIFHGQLTPDSLNAQELISLVNDIRSWSRNLGDSAEAYFDYSGFSSSFRKAADAKFLKDYRIVISNIQEYKQFLKKHVKRQ